MFKHTMKKLLMFLVSTSVMAQTSIIRQNTLTLGRGSATDKKIIFDNGSGASNPAIKWNNSSTAIQFANDGSTFTSLDPAKDSSSQLLNLTLTATVSANALTIAAKTKAAANASSTDPIYIGMRNSTAGTGTYNQRSITGALSMVVSSGSTLGTVSATQAYLYVYALDNAGTVELAVSRTLFGEGSVQSSTAEGGAGAADSIGVLYSTTARTNVPLRLIGRLSVTETTAGTWDSNPTEISLAPFDQIYNPTIQKFTTGSGTYTTPIGVKYIRVVMVGGGGGGAGGGNGATGGNNGGNSTFGTTLLVANGGSGGNQNSQGAAGGSASLGTGPIGIAVAGGSSTGSISTGTGGNATGSGGASSVLGGGGGGGFAANIGTAAATNSGSGGGGGGVASGSGTPTGAGGGAGGYVDAIITSPLSATYSYATGSGGSGGNNGTNGGNGAAGAAGQIVVYEYYK